MIINLIKVNQCQIFNYNNYPINYLIINKSKNHQIKYKNKELVPPK